MEFTRKHRRCRITHTHHQNTQAEPSVRRKFRFRALATKVDPCHDEFTRKRCRCRIMHTHHQSTRQEPTLQRRWRYEAPAETEAYTKSPLHPVSPPGTTTRNKHYLPQHAPQTGVTQETPHTGSPSNSPAPPSCLAKHQAEEKECGYGQMPPTLQMTL